VTGPVRWDAELYAAHSGHHRRYDADMLLGLRLPPDADVLDLGCGVGDLTARLAALVPHGRVLGVDADPDMVVTARTRAAGTRASFEVCPAERLTDLLAPQTFDVVVSRAVLHWVPAHRHPQVLAGVHTVLRPGGVLRAELGGVGQIAALREILDAEAVAAGGTGSPWFFPDLPDYRPLLAAAGFRTEPDGWLRLLHQRRPFGDEADLLGFLRSQILLGYEPGLPLDAVAGFRSRCEERAVAELRRRDGSFDQDFVRLDLLAYRS
jgi:SAM-dependent methyltransferase